jgi:mRNA interferase MazF
MTNPAIARGEVYWADLDPQKGSEQKGRRPVIVVQVDILNRNARTVVVVPLTSKLKYQHLPCCVFIPHGTCALSHDSVALCHQIRVLDKGGIVGYICTLPSPILGMIEDRIRFTLGL